MKKSAALLLALLFIGQAGYCATYEKVDLAKSLEEHGFRTKQYGTNILSVSSNVAVICHPDSRFIQVNRKSIWLNAPVESARNGTFLISKADLNHSLLPAIKPSAKARKKMDDITVMIDPGHGGESPGAPAPNKTDEKSLVLEISRLVGKELKGSGITVKFTRTSDTTLDNSLRPQKAAKAEADIFVSIHMNASQNKESRGVETYVITAAGFESTSGKNGDLDKCQGNDKDSDNNSLAYVIHSALINETKAPDRGIKRARFEVLRSAPCPAVLVECGFLTNDAESKKLVDGKYKESIARGIAKGIRKYAGLMATD